MAEKPNAFHTLGLELNSQTIKGIQLNQRKGKAYLTQFYSLPVAELSNEGQKQNLHTAINKSLTVTCLGTSDVLVRQLEVKLKKDKDIDATLPFQSEPLLPYPIEEGFVDRIALGETAEGTQLTVLAARKEQIQHHLEQWHTLDMEPEMVSCVPAALAEFAAAFAPSEAPQFIVHLGTANTTCAVVRGGLLIGAQACSQGIAPLEAAFRQDQPEGVFEEIDFATFDHEALPTLHLTLEAMRLEITRILYALTKLTKGQEPETILITGEGGALNNLGETLCQPLGKPLSTPISNDQILFTTAQLQHFAIPLGAALSGLPGAKDAIDFRQQELVYPNPWKRYKTPLAIYLGLSLALALAFAFLGNAYIKYQEDGLRQQYSELLQFMHRPYTAFENEFTAKAAGKKQAEPSAVATPIENLSADDILARMHYLEKDLQATPDIYPLLPNVPTVSDVLAWLSTQPTVTAKDPKTSALKPLLQIESFSYTYVKRPEQNKKQERYQVKVELEFSSPTPKAAREFHDALISPNAFVDPKGEVKWNTNRGLYKASFFLKDKTQYPS